MPWKCPKCERVLKNPNQWHSCIKQDFEKNFITKHPNLLFLFETILAEVYDWKDIHISATKNCIVFVTSQTFFVIKPMKSQLNLKIYLDHENNNFPIVKVTKYGKRLEHHIRISEPEDINSHLITLIRASHNLFK